MTLNRLISAGALAATLGMSSAAGAATASFVVDARLNSISLTKLERGLGTVVLKTGQSFSIATDTLDTWSVGPAPAQTGNASGAQSRRFYTSFGAAFNHGTLVGRVGEGAFFAAATPEARVADVAGLLRLYMWDVNDYDNTGSITASVTTDIAPVPLAATAPLLLAALGGLAVLRRRSG
jgi:hypothetical protein